MPRLYHPRTAKPVDVNPHDRLALAYYRSEGYLENPGISAVAAAAKAAAQANADLARATDDLTEVIASQDVPDDVPGGPNTDSGEQSAAGSSLEL